MKHLFKILVFTLISTFVVSCNDDEPNPNVTYKATLSGANETTPNSSTATGTGTLVFNTTTKIFTITVVHTLASPTVGHIHKAAAGANGPVVFPFSSLVSPIMYTSAALTAEQEADLNAGLYYVNLHSAAFPGGEIRGNLTKQ
ncbi:CHRD domain-containing protein [Flavobacterium sp.]|uniref:CHRD domain-containing protein n=1 Tax=Flavobacterium sp. TaxID=239 RepID=UPI00286A43E4|nr:CHRD domain-containing protein [Flavobacterium sp.]